MSGIEALVSAYRRFVTLPWDTRISGPQKVWFAVYEPEQERRLRARIGEFEVATKQEGHGWLHVDLTDAFAQWMQAQEYRERYFDQPEMATMPLQRFGPALAQQLQQTLSLPEADENCVVALSGIASLFGLASLADLVQAVAPAIQGRLLVLFPGERDGNHYRLLDAHIGWNYLAVPITAQEDAV